MKTQLCGLTLRGMCNLEKHDNDRISKKEGRGKGEQEQNQEEIRA
jgi:hypothetical protein